MAKRKPEEPPKGAPAWQSTFADLMNLLLCFFVMLFAMSTIDAEKFALVAASFSQTFSIFDSGGSSLLEGLLINNGVSQLSQLDEYMNTMGQAAASDTESDEFKEFDEKVSDVQEEMLKQNEQLAEKIDEALAEQNLTGDIDVDFTSQYVELTLNGALLFDSGKHWTRFIPYGHSQDRMGQEVRTSPTSTPVIPCCSEAGSPCRHRPRTK